MIPFVYYQTTHDLNRAESIEKVVSDGVDLNNLVLESEEFTNFKAYHLLRFDNLNSKLTNDIQKAEMCILLNNTDASNIVYIGTIVAETLVHASDPIFVRANTEGWFCTVIDVDMVNDEAWLGFHCEDCTGGNIISFETVTNTNQNVTEFEGTEGQALTMGSIVFEQPHATYLQLYTLPSELIKENYYRLLFFIGTFSLIFIMRWVYNITREGVDY